MWGRENLGTGDPWRIGPEIESFSCSVRWLREKHSLQRSLLSGSWLCPTQLRRAACALKGLCQSMAILWVLSLSARCASGLLGAVLGTVPTSPKSPSHCLL